MNYPKGTRYPDYLREHVNQDSLDRLGIELPPRSNTNLVIAGGGLDLSGKSTSLRNIALEINASYVYCMDNNPLNLIRGVMDQSPTLLRYLYYIAVPMYNYRKLERLRANGHVFLDQSVYGTIAYHLAYGLDPKYLRLIPSKLVDQIDALLYFSVPENVRRSRMEDRKVSKTEEVTLGDMKSFQVSQSVENHYLEIRPEITEVVTTHDQTEAEVVKSVISFLNLR